MSIILAKILSIRPVLVALTVIVCFTAFGLYDSLIDDPAVAAKARQGYVNLAEKTALEAQLLEQKRQARIAQDAASRYQSERDVLDDQLAKQTVENAERVKRYVEMLRSQGKSDDFTLDDINELRRQR